MFLTKCDQEKYINVAWEAFKAGLFCPLTSSLLRDHLSPSVKEQLRIVLCLSFVTFLTKCDQNKQFLFGWQISMCKQFLSTDLTFITTRSQYMGTFLSPSVCKILTACWFKKTLLLGYVQNAEMHSFPLMYIMGGYIWPKWVKKKYFLQKSAEKQRFWGTQI